MLNRAYRPIAATVLAATIAAAAAIVLPGVSDKVVASAPLLTLHSGKGDRLDIRPLGTNCSEQAWPYFEASCVRNPRQALGRAKPARIVGIDRLELATR
jgi:hypothetical protein